MTDAYAAVTIGGVQEFIAAARRTADLWGGSRLMSHLCGVAVQAVESQGGHAVLPASVPAAESLPNRLFAVVPAGRSAEVAEHAVQAVRNEWKRLAGLAHTKADLTTQEALATFPDVRWVAWEPPETAIPYVDAWRTVTSAADARKRVRDFSAYTGKGKSTELCSLCGRRDGHAWPQKRLHVSEGERLCVVCVVKRDSRVMKDLVGQRTAFPSTASVATAPFRERVLRALEAAGGEPSLSKAGEPSLGKAVDDHRLAVKKLAEALDGLGAAYAADQEVPDALPRLESLARSVQRSCGGNADLVGWVRLDGNWCYADSWQAASILRECGLRNLSPQKTARLEETCRRGREATRNLYHALAEAIGVEAHPASYLALFMQDADNMGERLSGRGGDAAVSAEWHEQVSTALMTVGRKQAEEIGDRLGRVVYAGGDDLLGLLPALHALPAAQRCRDVFGERTATVLPGATASAGVVFFHHSYPLQEALRRAREALEVAKTPSEGKDRLAVVVVRRGGERARAALPWRSRGVCKTAALTELATFFSTSLSARMLADLQRERQGIADLAVAERRHRAEVSRLVQRHAGQQSEGPERLVRDLEPPGDVTRPEDVDAWVETLEVARFLSQ